MARHYHVEGTKSFFYAAIICAGLAAWHIFDGWVPQERWLERYPEFPTSWYDLGLYEFYSYNRWTGIIFAVAAIICAYVHRVVK